MRRKVDRLVANAPDRPVVTGNSFLDSLPAHTRVRLAPMLVKRAMSKRQILSQPDAPFTEVFFPVRSVISTLTGTVEGAAIEVGLAGHEGLSPIALAFGSRISRHTTVVQVPDSAHCMDADAFLAELDADAALKQRALLYAEYSFAAATQFTACNGLHPVEERYARWILMADDRAGTPDFSLTQEFSAQMLGVRRASVTTVARGMSEIGLISYHRGQVSVKDRAGLEEAACECYVAVNGDLQRLMGYGARQAPLPTPM
jgi:CRP-like cAMP-binding protein